MLLLRALSIALAWSVRATTASSRSWGRQSFLRNSRSSSSSGSSSNRNHAGGALGDEPKAKHASGGWKGAGLEMKLPLSVKGAKWTRGGACLRHPGTEEPLFHRSGIGVSVNRQAVPAAEALSRFPTLKTPGGLVRLLDYVGTISFAMSGAATAGMRGMNLIGCLFVGIMAATGGGTVRDLLMGQTPVFWLVEVEYVGICAVTALSTFIFWPILSRVSHLSHMGTGMDGWLSQTIDTIGLASFAVAGTQHGIRGGFHPLITIFICCITCSGGGILRDIMTSSPVLVLSSHAQMYVSTTAIGSAAYLLARRHSQDPFVRISVGFFCVVLLRLLACSFDLRLPTMV